MKLQNLGIKNLRVNIMGKSTFVDAGFVIEPILEAIDKGLDLEVIYFSFEIDRVSKEFDFAAHFLHRDFQIERITLDEGVTIEGKKSIELSPDYLRGRLQDDEGKIIKVKDSVFEALQEVYIERIIPIFGEYDMTGKQISPGYINFIEQKDNPTGLYKFLKTYAEENGKFISVKMGQTNRIVGYTANNPDKYTIIVTDHLRKLILERGWAMKQVVDKYIEYSVELRNWCQFTFVHIIHLNRAMASQDRLRLSKDMLYPTSDDIKDTGNLAEDADYVFTIMNPNDERYNLSKHFGIEIKDSRGNEYFPNMRTVHLVESRHCHFPQHFKTTMKGGFKSFKQLKID